MDGASSEVLPEEHLEILHNLEPDYYLDPKKRPYRTSQNHVSNWYCHPSVYALETENIPGVKPDNVPDSFFQAEYKYGETLTELEARIETIGLPCIVHVTEIPENVNEGPHTKHSMLVFGRDNQGEMVCWEKEGYKVPFRVVSLSKVFEEYNRMWKRHWGVRKLRAVQP